MSILKRIIDKACSDENIKNSDPITSTITVRLEPNVYYLLDIIAYLNKNKSLSDFVYSFFSKALYNFCVDYEELIETLEEIADKINKEELKINPEDFETAINMLLRKDIITHDFSEVDSILL